MVEGRPDIAAFLARTGMNQSELARRLGTTSANVSKWVRGEGVPSYGICVSLLKMGMTIGELFGDEVQKRNNSSLSPSLSDEECRAIVERGIATLGRR